MIPYPTRKRETCSEIDRMLFTHRHTLANEIVFDGVLVRQPSAGQEPPSSLASDVIIAMLAQDLSMSIRSVCSESIISFMATSDGRASAVKGVSFPQSTLLRDARVC